MNEVDKCHMMIDIETYSTKSNAVIRTIGVVLFNMKGDTEILMHKGISIESCLMAGLEIDQDTVNFWRKQPREYRSKLQAMGEDTLETVLHELRTISQGIGEQGIGTEWWVWSHGSNFDIVILENAYKGIGQMPWWKYSNVRDTRTLFDLADYKYIAKGGHDALEDAIRQAEAVAYAYQQLKKG